MTCDIPLSQANLRSDSRSISPRLGVNPDTHEAVATFDLAAVWRLPASGFNVVITTPTGERICRVSRRQQAELVRSE